jgi:hypothetical protein
MYSLKRVLQETEHYQLGVVAIPYGSEPDQIDLMYAVRNKETDVIEWDGRSLGNSLAMARNILHSLEEQTYGAIAITPPAPEGDGEKPGLLN